MHCSLAGHWRHFRRCKAIDRHGLTLAGLLRKSRQLKALFAVNSLRLNGARAVKLRRLDVMHTVSQMRRVDSLLIILCVVEVAVDLQGPSLVGVVEVYWPFESDPGPQAPLEQDLEFGQRLHLNQGALLLIFREHRHSMQGLVGRPQVRIGPAVLGLHQYLQVVGILATDDGLVQEANRVVPELFEAYDCIRLLGDGSHHLVPFFLQD